MCLQWCHRRMQVIDNDLACAPYCPFGDLYHPDAPAPEGDVACATCVHRHGAGEGAWCGLTRSPLPMHRRCCHHNVSPTDLTQTRVVRTADCAPWTLWMHGVATAQELFAVSDTAPPGTARGDGAVEVSLDALSVPLVYGAPAAWWDVLVSLGPHADGR